MEAFAVLAREALRALALVGAGQVDAGATMLALSWNVTLIDVGLALLSREACEASAGELVGHGGTGASVRTGLGQAGVGPLTQLPWRSENRTQPRPRKWRSAPRSPPHSPTQQVTSGSCRVENP